MTNTDRTSSHILYVEDDPTLSFVTKDNLEQFGYKVTHFDNGQVALQNFTFHKFDLCLLDVMLPKMDGFELAKRIRKQNENIPILFLSAKSQTEDKIQGLELGADDYITKPFSMEELKLKIEVFLKRPMAVSANNMEFNVIKAGTYELDTANCMLRHKTIEIKLTHRETILLEQMFTNKNMLLKRDEILRKVWGDDSYFNSRSLDVFLSRIRKYLKHDSALHVENVRGVGFRLNVI